MPKVKTTLSMVTGERARTYYKEASEIESYLTKYGFSLASLEAIDLEPSSEAKKALELSKVFGCGLKSYIVFESERMNRLRVRFRDAITQIQLQRWYVPFEGNAALKELREASWARN